MRLAPPQHLLLLRRRPQQRPQKEDPPVASEAHLRLLRRQLQARRVPDLPGGVQPAGNFAFAARWNFLHITSSSSPYCSRVSGGLAFISQPDSEPSLHCRRNPLTISRQPFSSKSFAGKSIAAVHSGLTDIDQLADPPTRCSHHRRAQLATFFRFPDDILPANDDFHLALICVVGFIAVARCAWLRRNTSSSAANSKLGECPICLAEYADGDEIRLLPQCGHGFHVACIDTWLGSPSSCIAIPEVEVKAREDNGSSSGFLPVWCVLVDHDVFAFGPTSVHSSIKKRIAVAVAASLAANAFLLMMWYMSVKMVWNALSMLSASNADVSKMKVLPSQPRRDHPALKLL
ncbi:hypothetical protein TEA_025793 [Camellia sinensis var. sinensis]|uniref:RING-type domain-containing protein n=1 Tax=Camellia sinensis var. sinensis TaxID=542762 RepID=A0A4S4ERG9_CAMSN|nr:hypothetical protein TEA_025793 [Camellia sinensis var. sinensis]